MQMPMPNSTRAAVLLLLLLAACRAADRPAAPAASEPAPPVTSGMPGIALPPELDRILRDYEREWRAKDAAKLAALFTDDGFVLPNNEPPARGAAGIVRAYTGHGGPLTLAALAFAVDDTVGYIVGTYGGPDVTTHEGKYLLALRRAPGGPWLIAADMDNENAGPDR
jgi:ketosteroid isomerase-like protein